MSGHFERSRLSEAGSSGHFERSGNSEAGSSGHVKRFGRSEAGSSGHFERSGRSEAGPSGHFGRPVAQKRARAAILGAKWLRCGNWQCFRGHEAPRSFVATLPPEAPSRIYVYIYIYIYILCVYTVYMYTSYCVAQQQPQKPGNLFVKKKATHIISPAPGASKVTKLASGDHFVFCKIFVAAIWSKLCTGGRNRAKKRVQN